MNIAVYGRQMDNEYADVFRQFIEKLEHSDVNYCIYEPFYEKIKHLQLFKSKPELFSTHRQIRYFANFLISVGGDGTLLNSLTLIRNANIPVLGLNFGRLGFLSSISEENVIPAIDLLLKKKYELEPRTLLRVTTNNNAFGELCYGLNDFTIQKSNSATLIVVDVYVNNSFLNSYWADGLIISTPTGSTGYSLSCNGPILTPDSENFIITPIATHNLTVRPIVLPDNSMITVKLRGREEKYTASLDSRTTSVGISEEFYIRKESFKIKLVKMPDETFFNTIRSKLNWGLDYRN